MIGNQASRNGREGMSGGWRPSWIPHAGDRSRRGPAEITGRHHSDPRRARRRNPRGGAKERRGRQVILGTDDMGLLKQVPRTICVVVSPGSSGTRVNVLLANSGVAGGPGGAAGPALEVSTARSVDAAAPQMRKRNVTLRLGEARCGLDRPRGRSDEGKRCAPAQSGNRICTTACSSRPARVAGTRRLNLGAAGLDSDERGRDRGGARFRTRDTHLAAGGCDRLSQAWPKLGRAGTPGACAPFGSTRAHGATSAPNGITRSPRSPGWARRSKSQPGKKIPTRWEWPALPETLRGQFSGTTPACSKMCLHREGHRLPGSLHRDRRPSWCTSGQACSAWAALGAF